MIITIMMSHDDDIARGHGGGLAVNREDIGLDQPGGDQREEEAGQERGGGQAV